MRPEAGERVDLAPFGGMAYWTGSDRLTIERHEAPRENGVFAPVDVPEQGGSHLGIEWNEPRRFERIIVRFADEVPSPDQVKLQYWHHTWPEQWVGGWTAVDDPYNGKWVTAHGQAEISGDTWRFTFDPLDITELPRAEDFTVTFRQTLKVRLLFKDVAPNVREIEVLGTSVWKEADLRIEFGLSEHELKYAGSISAHDGYVISVDDSDPKSVLTKVLYADGDSTERTVITVGGDRRTFSFLVTDALSDGVRIPDLGMGVRASSKSNVQSSRLPELEAPTLNLEPETLNVRPPIYDRILTEPEQSYERASREIPQLIKTRQDIFGRYVPIGCDANRQEFALRYNAEIFADKHELKVVGRDTAKLLWPGKAIFYKFPTGDPPDFRYREDATEQSAMNGCLPIYTSEWKDREFLYEMTSFAALLSESPWNEEKKRGDEPVVALSRIKIRNTTEEKRTARFWIMIENPEELALDEDGFIYATGRARDDSVPDAPIQKRWVVEKYPVRRLRAHVNTRGRGNAKAASCTYEPFGITGIPNAIAYDIELEPRMAHEIELFIPFITFRGDEGRHEINSLDYDAKLAEMANYWQKQIEAGARIEVPEELLTDFNRANLAHIAITADKDIDTGLYMLGAGTWRYQVYGTETADQTR
ncbi:MAG: hypothetical protein NTU88_11025 [Armatimonadetes bacterium]|nr:hypothetical protein [Armatimonadota bacterium]